MNNLNKIYQKLKQNNPNLDDRLAKQQAWVIRDKMMFESSVSVSSSSAAGAGGGGTSYARKNQTVDFPKILADHWVVTWADVATDTWKIIVYNYTSGVLSDVIDTGLIYDSSSQWVVDTDQKAVSESGHCIIYQNNSTSKFKIYFFNSNGQVLGIKDFDSSDDFQYTENAMALTGILDGVRTVYHFDGANVRTHQFPGISDIEVDDASDDDVLADGSIVIEAPNYNSFTQNPDAKFYIGRPGGELVDITNDMFGLNVYRTSYNADFIFRIDQDSDIKIISQEGVLKNTFDLTPFSTTSINESGLYGDNCAFASINTSNGYRVLVNYDGDTNQFVSFTFSDSLNVSFDAFEIYWYDPNPSFGKTFIYYSSTTIANGALGYDGQDFEIKWLPKGASSFESHSFGSATVSFIDGIGFYDSGRIFSEGENPITMYAESGDASEIMVGFLTSTGFLTQSTGILAASCSNIWGKPIGEKSFAVFDVGSERVWQVYGATSIEAETMTTSDWTWGSSNRDVHRNGTLAVLDGTIGSQSFVYTTEVGLIAGPTYTGAIYNEVNSGNRTGISTEYQVIVRYVPEQTWVQGFQLVSKAGLSEFVDCFPGLSPSSNYNVDEIKIGSDLISISFTEDGTGNFRIQNYKTSDLTLIDDYDSGTTEINVSLYKNRCRIYQPFSTPGSPIEYTARFVGAKGVETFTFTAYDLNTEANDTQDNG